MMKKVRQQGMLAGCSQPVRCGIDRLQRKTRFDQAQISLGSRELCSPALAGFACDCGRSTDAEPGSL
jgi:hypothetical protein